MGTPRLRADGKSLPSVGWDSRTESLARHAAAKRDLHPEVQSQARTHGPFAARALQGNSRGERESPSGTCAVCRLESRARRARRDGERLDVEQLSSDGRAREEAGMARNGC